MIPLRFHHTATDVSIATCMPAVPRKGDVVNVSDVADGLALPKTIQGRVVEVRWVVMAGVSEVFLEVA